MIGKHWNPQPPTDQNPTQPFLWNDERSCGHRASIPSCPGSNGFDFSFQHRGKYMSSVTNILAGGLEKIIILFSFMRMRINKPFQWPSFNQINQYFMESNMCASLESTAHMRVDRFNDRGPGRVGRKQRWIWKHMIFENPMCPICLHVSP